MLSSLTNRSVWWSWLVALAFCSTGDVPLARGDEEPPAAAAPAAAGKPAAAAPNTSQSVPADVATMLLTAMHNNPDVAVSQSDVDEAEAELNRVRLDVARQVVVARAAVASQRQKLGYIKDLPEKHVVSMNEVQLEEFKLDPLEADLRYLLGGAEFRFEAKDENGGATRTEMGLSTMLTTAMEKNPDIVLAKAKLRVRAGCAQSHPLERRPASHHAEGFDPPFARPGRSYSGGL